MVTRLTWIIGSRFFVVIALVAILDVSVVLAEEGKKEVASIVAMKFSAPEGGVQSSPIVNREFGELLLDVAEDRYVYRFYPYWQNVSDGDGEREKDGEFALSLGYDGSHHWIAINQTNSLKPCEVTIFKNWEDTRARPLHKAWLSLKGRGGPMTYEEFFYSRAIVHDLQRRIGAMSLSNTSLTNALSSSTLVHLLDSEDACRIAGGFLLSVEWFQNASKYRYARPATTDEDRGRVVTNWTYLLQLDEDDDVSIRRMIAQIAIEGGVGAGGLVGPYPLPLRVEATRQDGKREVSTDWFSADFYTRTGSLVLVVE